jgi:hypothetical protein
LTERQRGCTARTRCRRNVARSAAAEWQRRSWRGACDTLRCSCELAAGHQLPTHCAARFTLGFMIRSICAPDQHLVTAEPSPASRNHLLRVSASYQNLSRLLVKEPSTMYTERVRASAWRRQGAPVSAVSPPRTEPTTPLLHDVRAAVIRGCGPFDAVHHKGIPLFSDCSLVNG